MERNTVFSEGLENCQLSLPHPAVVVMSLDKFLFTIFVKVLKPIPQLL